MKAMMSEMRKKQAKEKAEKAAKQTKAEAAKEAKAKAGASNGSRSADMGDLPRERPPPVVTNVEKTHAQVGLDGEPLPKPDVLTNVKESKTYEYKSPRFDLVIKSDALEKIQDMEDVNDKRKKLLAKIKPKKDIEDLPKGQKAKETDDLIRAALEQVIS